MGVYINPINGQTKEEWLTDNAVCEFTATQIVEQYESIRTLEINLIPVAWVNNGPFTAAAVLFDIREAKDMTSLDGRPKKFFGVPRTALADNASGVGETTLSGVGL